MSDREDTAKTFLKSFETQNTNTVLPAFLRETYQVLSCTYSRKDKECYLVRDKKTNETYILKFGQYTEERAPLNDEHDRMQLLSAALPDEYTGSKYWREGDTEYLLRPYIQGMNLEQYQECHHTLPLPEVLDIGIGICDSVSKLHSLRPCVLHRDIKPQNLIIDNNGHIHLIDFETAREYKENKSKDTVFLGTEGNAAPEQYGFSQTDVRSDVYGIGKVLEYLYEENKDSRTWAHYPAREKQQLQKLIQTATAFDPKNRYQHVLKLRSALKQILCRIDVLSSKRHRVMGLINLAVAAALVVITLFVADRFHDSAENGPTEDNSVPFYTESTETEVPKAEEENGEDLPAEEEQIITFDGTVEHAAALTLEKESLSPKAYDQITRIAVVGNQVYYSDTDLETLEDMVYSHDFGSEIVNGGIDDISIVSKMKNLREVFFCNQKITDITPLKGLDIEKLYLSGNEISDFSAVESMGNLTTLYMVDNPVSVLPDLKKCRLLTKLNLSGNTYNDLEVLRDTGIGTLYITEIYVKNKNFQVLKEMKNLSFLYTSTNQKEVYEVIPDLTGLTGLALWGGYDGSDLSIIKNMPELKNLFVMGDSIKRMDGIENASSMENLCIDGTSITDLSVLPKLPRLQFVKINGNDIKDFSPLFQCELLQRVSADPAQQKLIENMKAKRRFALVDN